MLSRVLSVCRALLLIAIAAVPAVSGTAEAQQGSAPASSPTSTLVCAPCTAPTATAQLYSAISASMARHFEPSYITFGGGYNTGQSVLGFNDLLYEAQIYVHYTWYDSAQRKNAATDSDVVRLMVPIRLQVRQFTSESSPVKTPSYNPGIRLYWAPAFLRSEDSLYYGSFGLHHYSNGQSGPHYDPDGTINTETGSFSTDYAELSLYRDRTHSWTKFNFRKYLIGRYASWEPEQSHYYEKALAEITWRCEFVRWLGAPSIQLTAGYKFNRDYVSPGVNASFKDNLQWTAEAMIPIEQVYHRWHWPDMRIYVRADLGYDYYNIHYQEKMQRIQVGIVATNF